MFSFLGMVSQEVPVGQKTEINVVLTATDARLDEVVVVGYDTQKKVNLTGSVASVSAEDLANRYVKNFVKFTGNEEGKKLVAAGPKVK